MADMIDDFKGNELIHFVIAQMREHGWDTLSKIDPPDPDDNWPGSVCCCHIDDDGFITGCENFDIEQCMPGGTFQGLLPHYKEVAK